MLSHKEFQFHKGAIRTSPCSSLNVKFFDFNSIKVRLEQDILKPLQEGFIYFNSIKVRLELISCQICRGFASFQFHKGAIRTLAGDFVWPMYENFNSIKVRLELLLLLLLMKRLLHFNSIKVRLEPGSVPSTSMSNSFQFHKGAIRTLCSAYWWSFFF